MQANETIVGIVYIYDWHFIFQNRLQEAIRMWHTENNIAEIHLWKFKVSVRIYCFSILDKAG